MTTTTFFDRHDFAALEAALGNEGDGVAGYVRSLADMVTTIKDRIGDAERQTTPANKVRYLELAKIGLQFLELAIIPGANVEIVGLAPAKSHIHRLEQTYRAFGYYRMAGVK